MRYKYLILLVTLICCEYSDETPKTSDGSRKDETSDSDDNSGQTAVKNSDFVPSLEDRDNVGVIKEVQAPNLVNEKDQSKGKNFKSV